MDASISIKSSWNAFQYLSTTFYEEISLTTLISRCLEEIISLCLECLKITSFGFLSSMEEDRIAVSIEEHQDNNSLSRNYDLFYINKEVLEKHLWSHVLCTSTKRMSHVIFHDFGQSIVSQTNMTFIINNDVLGLKISVKNLLFVKMRHSWQSLKEVKFSIFLTHSSYFSQQIEQLSSIAILHTEEKIMLSLKRHVELSDKRMARTPLKNGSLVLHYILFHVLHYELLIDCLQGHKFTISSTKIDPWKPSSSNTLDNLETIQKTQTLTNMNFIHPQLQFLHIQFLHLPLS